MAWRLDLHDLHPGEAFSIHRFGPRAVQDFPLHTHREFHELFTVVAGQVEHRTAHGCEWLEPGAVVFVRVGDEHALRFARADYLNLNLPVQEWQRFSDYVGHSLPLSGLISASRPPATWLEAARHRQLVADLHALFTRQHAPDSRAALAAVLLRWLPCLPAERATSWPEWLTPLLAAIQANLETGLTIADLPRVAGVSREHLARTFRQHLATTPTAWLAEQKLQRAELLLQRSDLSLLAISERLGYGSISWFHRVFRQRHGCTPGRWRERQMTLTQHSPSELG